VKWLLQPNATDLFDQAETIVDVLEMSGVK
jgi:hypothetical protein